MSLKCSIVKVGCFFLTVINWFQTNVEVLYALNLYPFSIQLGNIGLSFFFFFFLQDMADYKSKGKVGGGVSASKAKSRDDDDDDDEDEDDDEEEDDEEDDEEGD